MPGRNREEQRRYLMAEADFWKTAVERQAARCLERGDWIDNRMDYTFLAHAVYTMGEIAQHFKRHEGAGALTQALEDFNEALPFVRDFRNTEAHARGPSGEPFGGATFFSDSVVKLGPGGKVTYLIDAEFVGEPVSRLHAAIVEYVTGQDEVSAE